jgi:glycosyltransferase involved in cell wall biosynthesis
MEALACGLPVVITALGGIPDIVTEGETGFLFAREDVRTMSERLEGLIRDPGQRSAMRVAARNRACKHFDSQLCTARLLEIMKKTVMATEKNGYSYTLANDRA